MEEISHNLNESLGPDFIAEGVIPSIFAIENKDVRVSLIDFVLRLLPVFPITSMNNEQIASFKEKVKSK